MIIKVSSCATNQKTFWQALQGNPALFLRNKLPGGLGSKKVKKTTCRKFIYIKFKFNEVHAWKMVPVPYLDLDDPDRNKRVKVLYCLHQKVNCAIMLWGFPSQTKPKGAWTVKDQDHKQRTVYL